MLRINGSTANYPLDGALLININALLINIIK